MGLMVFRLPGLSNESPVEDLTKSSVLGGHDRSPMMTRANVRGGRLTLARENDESGPSVVPWEVPNAGKLMLATTTLMERDRPYYLLVELARGKINQVRNQYADWVAGGLQTIPAVESLIKEATRHFAKGVMDSPDKAGDVSAGMALQTALTASETLARQYTEQVFRLRLGRGGKLDVSWGCRVCEPPAKGMDDVFRLSFNTVNVPLSWRDIEPTQSNYNWESADATVQWARDRGFNVAAGPLLDFSPGGLPDWVAKGDNDPVSLKSLVCDYIDTVVSRYRGRINRWLVSTGANGSDSLKLGEEDLIRLTALAADATWQIDSNLQVLFGISRPFGDYKAKGAHEYSGFIYADTLLRAGLPFAGVEMEFLPASGPRSDFARDSLDTSKQLDLFGLLGIPVHVTLGYPASRVTDDRAGVSPEGIGHWKDLSSIAQAEWASAFSSLALCKSFVAGVTWDHLSDAQPHRVPNGGLVDSRGLIRPAFDRLREIREKFVK
jgi:hypothetical protein